jgi:hypothetical protein
MSVSLAQNEAGLGAMWGEERAIEMLVLSMSKAKRLHMIFKTIITSQRKPKVYIFTGSESITHAILIF